MRAKRIFCVVAYDISDTKRRNKVIKLIEPYGKRVNYSVFECMFTSRQLENLQAELTCLLHKRKDTIAIYPICIDCYTKTRYIPAQTADYNTVHVYD